MNTISKALGAVLIQITLVVPALCQINDSAFSKLSPANQDFLLAGICYQAGQYDKAILLFQEALELDTANPSLSDTYWHVLIDNLGMSYGITGNLDKAEEIFRYGLSKDTAYPLFYYNIACAYAERENLDSTIVYLKRAYTFKANMLEGEQFPDPAEDGSFQRFMKEERFLSLLAQFKQESESVYSSEKPNYGDTVIVDINCDGVMDIAFGIKRDSIYELTVVLGPLTDSSMRSTIEFSIGSPALSQSDICGKEARVEVEALYGSDEEMMSELDYIPDGYVASERCKGLVVFAVGGECDRFHCYWNRESNCLDWWRL
ncbi:MAG: tetratricopeptide repeat protein [Candidatus Zixiibacteriota bacterium]